MSDIGEITDQVEEAPVVDSAEVPEVDAPVDGGQADGSGETTQETEVFDVDSYGDRTVTLKVGGEDVTVPLKEALSGYQRQADYTRKTQELSRAQAMMEALESNPEGTLQFLSQQYGGKTPQAQPDEPAFDDGLDPDDPVAQTLRSILPELQELRAYQTEQVLDRTLTGLREKYGEHFNEQEVIQAAAQRQITTPDQLEQVFRDITFDKFYATSQAQTQAASSAEADRAAREAAKAALAGTVVSGNGAPNGSAGAPPTSFDSFEDAFAAAKAATGASF